MADEILLTRVADIVSAQVGHNSVSTSDLPALIQSVYDALVKLGEALPPAEERRDPAVSIRSSVKPEAVTCLECGAKFKLLKRHLSTDHGLTPDTYRARWNLPASYPLVAPDYAARRKAMAVQTGLGHKVAPLIKPAKAKPPRGKALSPASGAAKSTDTV